MPSSPVCKYCGSQFGCNADIDRHYLLGFKNGCAAAEKVRRAEESERARILNNLKPGESYKTPGGQIYRNIGGNIQTVAQ